ncbi:ABC transporter ATP-binding protein [Tepidimicrobium xylanilyticum]|uniref:Iron complex transport system ATP-binding protein n=1 Tax=Tepidimicrobium xylanilyticum TaxID=1123352 RepID=A0A1H2ZJY5_9FIRM|nr:ABC transporter ATP-binding protein [Tepidimicrobium xylanilyticum]GMG96512.1 iron-dicitrate ABC transporter ATP-binding protein [Tepidimicrobium xylanilyticum]SDX17701.1 iron complex transport system ATP-binding protein [Tepidimicrobium xylanilyticum]
MIKLKDITAGYNGIEVIKNINISFEKGSITSIIGKNGCGKTTLLKTASKLLKPFSGDIILNGESIYNIPEKKLARKVSFLPQMRNAPNISVYNLVMHGRFPYLGFPRIPQAEDRAMVERAMKKLGIKKYKDKKLRELSGGERQKVYIGMVLAQDTDYIFLDEPTTYLDINHQLEILDIIKELKRMGKAVIMVIHDLNSALSISDKVCLMDRGEIVIFDSPKAVYSSKEIERVFQVKCEEVNMDKKGQSQYIFSI